MTDGAGVAGIFAALLREHRGPVAPPVRVAKDDKEFAGSMEQAVLDRLAIARG